MKDAKDLSWSEAATATPIEDIRRVMLAGVKYGAPMYIVLPLNVVGQPERWLRHAIRIHGKHDFSSTPEWDALVQAAKEELKRRKQERKEKDGGH